MSTSAMGYKFTEFTKKLVFASVCVCVFFNRFIFVLMLFCADGHFESTSIQLMFDLSSLNQISLKAIPQLGFSKNPIEFLRYRGRFYNYRSKIKEPPPCL